MSELLKLSPEEAERAIGNLKRATNGEPLEAIEALALALINSGDNNPQIQKSIELGRKFQESFNDFTKNTVDPYIAEFGKIYDIAVYMKQFDIGDVSTRDVSVSLNKIDESALMQ